MKQRSLSFKMWGILVVPMAGLIVVAAAAIYAELQMGESIQGLSASADRIEMALMMEGSILDIRANQRGFVLETAPEGMIAAERAINDTETRLRGNLKHFREVALNEAGRKDIDDILVLLEVWRPVSQRMLAFHRNKQDAEAAALRKGELKDVMDRISGKVSGLVARNKKFIEEKKTQAAEVIAASRVTILGVGAAALAVAAVLAFLMLRAMSRAFSRVVTDLSAGAEQTLNASEQVATSSQSMAQGASEQAASLEETSSTLEEISATTRQNADHAVRMEHLIDAARASADKGSGAMDRMVERIQAIKESSDKTARIIKTIDEIAFQTNLLALNAAVEAARAGDAGRGFAVVAEEVRNLALRSAQAAKETGALIEESQQRAQSGVAATTEAQALLSNILQNVQETSGVVREVSTASKEQSRGVEQISQAVTQMDQVTQANAANAEENAAASEELSAQAASQASIVNVLTEMVLGRTRNGRGAATAAGTHGNGHHAGSPAATVPGGGKRPMEASHAAPGGNGSLRGQIEQLHHAPLAGAILPLKAGAEVEFRNLSN